MSLCDPEEIRVIINGQRKEWSTAIMNWFPPKGKRCECKCLTKLSMRFDVVVHGNTGKSESNCDGDAFFQVCHHFSGPQTTPRPRCDLSTFPHHHQPVLVQQHQDFFQIIVMLKPLPYQISNLHVYRFSYNASRTINISRCAVALLIYYGRWVDLFDLPEICSIRLRALS